MKELDNLPAYLYCDDPECWGRHYLTLNRDVHGRWTVAYVEYKDNRAISNLAFNDNKSIYEALARVRAAYDRQAKRTGRTGHGDSNPPEQAAGC